MKYNYNYDKLRGRIREYCKTNKNYADYIGVSEQSLYNKLDNKVQFTQTEILKSIKILHIKVNEIVPIFFTEKV